MDLKADCSERKNERNFSFSSPMVTRERYGLKQIPIAGISASDEPSQKHLLTLQKQ